MCANLRLVRAMARRFSGRGAEYEELYQCGCLAMVNAAASFDAKRGAAFSSYAYKFIEGGMRECLRKARRTALPAAEGAGFEERSIASLSVRAALSKLDPRERAVLKSRFFYEKTQTETAKALLLSQPSVSRIERTALFKLGRELRL